MDADAVAVSPPSPVSPSGKPHRKFKVSEDLVLLRQVVAEEDIFLGLVTSRSWVTASENLSEACPRMAGIKPRALKERAEKLVKQHRTKDIWRVHISRQLKLLIPFDSQSRPLPFSKSNDRFVFFDTQQKIFPALALTLSLYAGPCRIHGKRRHTTDEVVAVIIRVAKTDYRCDPSAFRVRVTHSCCTRFTTR